MSKTTTIYWVTKDLRLIDRIRRRFNITRGMTVNGENLVTLETDKDMADLKACEDRGLVQIRNKPRADAGGVEGQRREHEC